MIMLSFWWIDLFISVKYFLKISVNDFAFKFILYITLAKPSFFIQVFTFNFSVFKFCHL